MKKLKLRKQSKELDKRLLFLTLILTILGLIAIADASAPQALNAFSDKYYFVKQQAIWALIGILGMIVVSFIHYSFWEKLSVPLFFVSLGLLVLVLLPGFGSQLLGARRWLVLGPITFQPSELMKLSLAVYIAKLASKKKDFLAYLVPLILVGGVIMLQPDLGTTLAIAAIGVAQIFVAGFSITYIAGLFFAGGLAGLLLILTSDYRRERLMTFIHAAGDPLGKAYHIRQILFALGLGGFWGVGLGNSRQKYLFLPEAATDSIFAIIAEELGFLGALAIIVMLAYFVYRTLAISKNAPDDFSRVLSIGLVVWIGGQMFLNIASMVAVVPLTGIPLPFFSYGGTALTMILVSTGILLNISKHQNESAKRRKRK